MNTLDEILNILSTFQLKDTFGTNGKTKLSDIFEKDIPKELNNYGVYIFTETANHKETIVYIGKNGTMEQNGQFSDHSLKKRIMQGKRKQLWVDKQNFKVYWFVTINKMDLDARNQLKSHIDVANIPSVIECRLLEKFYELERQLPKYNNVF